MSEGHSHGYDKLKPLTTVQEVFDVAIAFESTARDFYHNLAPKVSKAIRYLVEDLAAEEQRHFDLFSDMAKRADIVELMADEIKRPANDRKFSDCIQLPDLGENPDDQAVLQYALMREHTAMEQYRALADETPPGALHDLFEFLANEETKHKNELEAVYYEIVHSGGV